VSQKLRQELEKAEQLVWPFANPNLYQELKIQADKAGITEIESRIDKE
jgi:hypothetical protein